MKLVFTALGITSHPLTEKVIDKILTDAQEIIAQEVEALANGKDLDELNIDKSLLLRPLPQIIDETENTSESQHSASSDFNSSQNAKLAKVVVQAKGINSIQKAIKTYKEGKPNGTGSRACSIL